MALGQTKIAIQADGDNIEKANVDGVFREFFDLGGIAGGSRGSNLGQVRGGSLGGVGQPQNKVGTIQSLLSGIAAGLIDIPKGAFTLGASLMDLGMGSNNASKVENWFDDLTTFDEKAFFATSLFWKSFTALSRFVGNFFTRLTLCPSVYILISSLFPGLRLLLMPSKPRANKPA